MNTNKDNSEARERDYNSKLMYNIKIPVALYQRS